VVVLEGGVIKLRVPMETETLIKAMMVGHAIGEMPPDVRVMPVEPMVRSMAAAEREFTAGEGWRRTQHHDQERHEQQQAMFRHNSSPLPMFVPALQRDARVDSRLFQRAAPDAASLDCLGERALSHRALLY
jgi:hypothetical protein